jgi:hypothetical protein
MNEQGGSTFRSESGREVNFFRIAMMGVKGEKEIVEVEAAKADGDVPTIDLTEGADANWLAYDPDDPEFAAPDVSPADIDRVLDALETRREAFADAHGIDIDSVAETDTDDPGADTETTDGTHSTDRTDSREDTESDSDSSNGAKSKAADSGDSQYSEVAKAWVRYRGPMGGTGWASTITGEVRYQDKYPPGDEYEGADAKTERQANRRVKRASPENVARTAATVLDTTSDELMDAAYRESGGIMGSELVGDIALSVANRDREADEHSERVADLMQALADIDIDWESERETPDVSQPYPGEVPSDPNSDDNAPHRAWAGSPTPDDPHREDRRSQATRDRDRRQVRETVAEHKSDTHIRRYLAAGDPIPAEIEVKHDSAGNPYWDMKRSVVRLVKEWTRYEGSCGGSGWQHSRQSG